MQKPVKKIKDSNVNTREGLQIHADMLSSENEVLEILETGWMGFRLRVMFPGQCYEYQIMPDRCSLAGLKLLLRDAKNRFQISEISRKEQQYHDSLSPVEQEKRLSRSSMPEDEGGWGYDRDD